MAATLKHTCEALHTCSRLTSRLLSISIRKHTGFLFPAFARQQSSKSTGLNVTPSATPRTSLSVPPWPPLKDFSREEEQQRHASVVAKVSSLLAKGDYGRLFAVVHFASQQWKVTNDDLILVQYHVAAECGDRIRMEKVLMVGGEDFSLIGCPLLGRDLVRVEATVLEKTESWPKIHMRFWRRHRFQRKKIIIAPQTVLRINSVEVAPCLD